MLRRALTLVVALGACAVPRFAAVGPRATDATTTIERVELTWSNVYLLRNGDAYALVDSGSPIDRDKLYTALAAARVDPMDLRLVILTHGHADHAGLARWLQLYGARIVLGAGDVPLAAAGENLPLRATSLLGSALAPMFMFRYAPFTPDVVVGDAPLDLAPYGFGDARVVAMPGHTAGSLVVRIGASEALVGDMMTGGWFGGVVKPHQAGEHTYQADPRANHANAARLHADGIARFYTGHGGPIDRASVASWLRGVDPKRVAGAPR